MRDNRNLLPIVLIMLGFAWLLWTLLFGGRGVNFWGNGYSADRSTSPDSSFISNNSTPLTPISPASPRPTPPNSNLCGDDQNGNAAPMLQSTAGSARIAPVNGLAAARLRSSPSFGRNVVGCLRTGNLVSPTGRVSGTWSQVKLADNTLGWISTNQLN